MAVTHVSHARSLAVGVFLLALAACGSPDRGDPRTEAVTRSEGIATVAPKYPTVADSSCHGDSLALASGKRACAWLAEAQLLGEWSPIPADTFLIVLGRGCTDCDALEQVIVRRIGDPPLDWSHGPIPGDFTVPGDIHKADSASVIVARMRLYWGVCADDIGAGVVQVDIADRAREDSLLLLVGRLAVRRVVTDTLVRDRGVLERIATHVAQGRCHEIPRRDREQIDYEGAF